MIAKCTSCNEATSLKNWDREDNHSACPICEIDVHDSVLRILGSMGEMDETTPLLREPTRKSCEGSNPSASAINIMKYSRDYERGY